MCRHAKLLQSCLTLSDPSYCSPPGSPGHGLLQARTLEWFAISFSNAWKWSRSVVSDSSRSHGLQPTRLLHPWDFPSTSTGVGCHCCLCTYTFTRTPIHTYQAICCATLNAGDKFIYKCIQQQHFPFSLISSKRRARSCGYVFPWEKKHSPPSFLAMTCVSLMYYC